MDVFQGQVLLIMMLRLYVGCYQSSNASKEAVLKKAMHKQGYQLACEGHKIQRDQTLPSCVSGRSIQDGEEWDEFNEEDELNAVDHNEDSGGQHILLWDHVWMWESTFSQEILIPEYKTVYLVLQLILRSFDDWMEAPVYLSHLIQDQSSV